MSSSFKEVINKEEIKQEDQENLPDCPSESSDEDLFAVDDHEEEEEEEEDDEDLQAIIHPPPKTILPPYLLDSLSINWPINRWVSEIELFLKSKNEHEERGEYYFATIDYCESFQLVESSPLDHHPLLRYIWGKYNELKGDGIDYIVHTINHTIEQAIFPTGLTDPDVSYFLGIPSAEHNHTHYPGITIVYIRLEFTKDIYRNNTFNQIPVLLRNHIVSSSSVEHRIIHQNHRIN